MNEESSFITEASAKIFKDNSVFYNPVQQLNRDLSVTVINEAFDHPIRIFEGLSATGLRSIRYANEVKNALLVISNDIDQCAVDLIKKNIEYNKVQSKVQVSHGDVNFVMHQMKGSRLDVIDLDPYGSASPFLDSALQAIHDGGLICITCTDMAILCASYPEVCNSKYSAIPLRGEICHEMALRIILGLAERTANKYKKYIQPLLSCSIDFYTRIFIRVCESSKMVKESCLKFSTILKCVECKSFIDHPLMKFERNKYRSNEVNYNGKCPYCINGRMEMGGPIWNKSLHCPEFIARLQTKLDKDFSYLETKDRIKGLLALCSEELSDQMLFMSLTESASFLHSSIIPMTLMRSALLNANYTVSGSHTNPSAIKTNAPLEYYWSIWRAWKSATKNQTDLQQIIKDDVTGNMINFSKHMNAEPHSKSAKLKRFPENPVPNWGPLARAKKPKEPIS